MAKSNNKSEINKVREKLWNWMITANGQEKWFSMRAEAVEIIKNEAIKIKAQNGYVTYADLPDWVKSMAIDHMYYPEDVKLILYKI